MVLDVIALLWIRAARLRKWFYSMAFDLMAGSKRHTKAKHSYKYRSIFLINLVS